MTAPYLELAQPLIPVIAEYQPVGDRLPCDIYVPALPPIGTIMTIRDSDSNDRELVVTRISMFLPSPGKTFCTIHLAEAEQEPS
jgi:hypothetical protein